MLGIRKILCSVAALTVAASSMTFVASAATENFEVIMPGATLEVWDGSVAESYAGGSGTENDPYLISNGAQLALLMQDVNSTEKESAQKTYGLYYELTGDIVLNDVSDYCDWSEEVAPANEWVPGGAVVNYIPRGFAGHLDGNNYDIIGMYISNDTQYNGLFGYIYDGCVENLGIKYAYVNGGSNTAALSGYIRASSADLDGDPNKNSNGKNVTVTNCRVSDSTIIGKNNVGAFGGYIESYYRKLTFDKCSVAGHSSVEGMNYVGGIGGLVVAYAVKYDNNNNYAVTFSDCANAATVKGKNGIGGIFGSSKDFVAGMNGSGNIALLAENCVNNGAVVAVTSHIGNIAGTVGPVGREDTGVITHIINCYGNKDIANCGIYGYVSAPTSTEAGTSSLITNKEMANSDILKGLDFDNTWYFVKGYPVIKMLGDALGDGVLTAKDFIDALAAFTGEKNVEDDFVLQNIDFDGNGTYDLADVNQFIEYLKNKGATKLFAADTLRVALSTVKLMEDGDVAYNMDVYSPGVGKVETHKAYSIANIGDIVALNGDGEVRDRVYGNIYTPGSVCEIGVDNTEALGYVKVASFDDTTGQLTVEGSDEIYNLTDSTVVAFSDKSMETFKVMDFDVLSSTSKIYRQNDDKNESLRVFLCVEKVGEENKVLYAIVVRD